MASDAPAVQAKDDAEEATTHRRRKLRSMVITMGGERQKHVEELFAQPGMARDFERPVFAAGVSSRSLRNRSQFLRIANDAGLIPDEEWKAIENAIENPLYQERPERFFECLDVIPVKPGRRGSKEDVKLHYSVEMWRKAKTINRGRAVLGCTLAHLIALKRFVSEDFDVMLEDNVRAPPDCCADRVWEAKRISEEWNKDDGHECHFRYVGWLGSVPNLKWMYTSHIPKRGRRSDEDTADGGTFPFPSKEDIQSDLENMANSAGKGTDEDGETSGNKADRRPGGNPIWGSYGYWISKLGFERLLQVLRNDVGALLWKGKRARYYSVKPVDKVLPRQIMSLFGDNAVHLPSRPAFFRAPMLTSKIHTQWDPEFCKSTQYQLEQSGLEWADLWLTEDERCIVDHHEQTDTWLTIAELSQLDEEDVEKRPG